MVSKNNRYLKDVLQADKTQHWSLRKLGIGVTSVLLGTTFYLGGNTVAHADQLAAPATAPADNGGQVATVSPAESGNTTVLKASASTAPTSQSVASQTSATPQVASASNNNQGSMTANQVKSENNLETPSSASLSTNGSVNGALKTVPTSSDTTQILNTNLSANDALTQNQFNAAVLNQSLAVKGENKNTNPTNEEMPIVNNVKIELTDGGKILSAKKTHSMATGFPFGIQGGFQFEPTKNNGSNQEIQIKQGQTYTIAQLKQTSNNGKLLPFGNFGDTCYVNYGGKQVGSIEYDDKSNTFKFIATNSFSGIGNINVTFKSGPNMLIINGGSGQTDKHLFKTNDGSNYVATISLIGIDNHQKNQYHLEFIKDHFQELHSLSNGIGPVLRHNSANLHFTNGNIIINNDVFNQLQNSRGQKGKVEHPTTYKIYYRISGDNLKDKFDNAIVSLNIFPVDSNGKLVNEDIEGHGNKYLPQRLTNNLSLSEIDNRNFTGVAYSKQNDGSYLFVFHIPSDSIKLNKDDINLLKNSETAVFGSENAVDQATSQYYGYDNKTGQILTGKDGKPLAGLPISLESYITVYYKDPNNYNSAINYQMLDAQGKTLLHSTATPAKASSQVSTMANVYVHYLNIDTGSSISKEESALMLPPIDPNTAKSLNSSVKLPQGPEYANYHLATAADIKQEGNVITLGNGKTITLNANDTVVIPKAGSDSFTVTYPSQEGQTSIVYVFYQGNDEEGGVQILGAKTEHPKGPNDYKLLETIPMKKGHFGTSISFAKGQDPETIVNHYVYDAHYIYHPTLDLNQDKQAYQFNKTYTYQDNADNNSKNIYHIYLNRDITHQEKIIKRTIRYVNNNGDPMPGINQVDQTVTFEGTNDKTAGTLSWKLKNGKNVFSAVTSPTIPGYKVFPATVTAAPDITPDTPDEIVTVVYTPTVNIENLTVDYVDDVTGNTLQADHFAGNEGASANYNTLNTIKSYENRGYRLVADPTNGQNLKYDGKTYTIHFTHTVVPVTPNQPQPDYNYGKENLLRKVTRTINYINADGKLVGNKTDAMNFVGTGYFDKVTHQLVSLDSKGKITGLGHLTWAPDKESLPAVTSPTINGEHVALITPADQADGTNVKGVTFDYNSGNLMIDVYYVKDEMVAKNAQTVNIKQTVHFVNAAGKTVLPDNVQTITFKRTPDVTNETTGKTTTGAWDKTSDTYHDVTVPTLNGYVANMKLIKGQTITHDSKDSVITVVYQPTGKLIPVDQHGNPIKGAATPQYPTDSTDPTKVTPNEAIPVVPGYRPADGQSTTVTPVDPIQNTDVHYTNEQVAVVNYIDANTGKQLATSGPIYGESNSPIAYSTKGELAVLGTMGYRVVSDDFDTKAPQMFDHDVYTQQNYTILLSNSQSSQGSQGSNSQQSQTSQTSQTSQGSDHSQTSQTSQTSQGSDHSQTSQTSQGSDHSQTSQTSQTSQGSDHSQTSQTSQTSQGSDHSQTSQTSQTSQGSDHSQTSQTSQTSQGSDHSQTSQTSQTSQVTPNDGQTTITITYTDQDNGGQPVKTITVTGKPGTKLGYDPTTDEKTLEDQGYVIVKNNIPNDTTFNSDPNKNSYTITVKHGIAEYGPNTQHQAGTPINPADPNGAKWPAKDTYSKSYTATVHFTDPNGNKLVDDNVQTSNWTRTVKVDKVTGQVLDPDTAWTPDIKRYQDVTVPVVDGYYATQKTIAGQPAVQQNIENTVVYHKLGKVIPVDDNGKPITGTTTPAYRNDPNDPTKALSPQLPTIPGYTATTDQVTPANPGNDTYVTYTKNTNNTGNGNGGSTGNGNGSSTNNRGATDGTGNSATNGSQTSGNSGLANGGQTSTGSNSGLKNGGNTNGYSAGNPGLPGLATTGYTGGNGLGGQPVMTGAQTVNNGTTTNAASGNSALPQTGNDAAQAIALGGLGALATLSLLGAAKKRHE